MRRNSMACRIIVMIIMLLCVFWWGGGIRGVEAQSNGQIICTNKADDYKDALVIGKDILGKSIEEDFFSSTFKSDNKKRNPFELHIKKDTTLVINGPIVLPNDYTRYVNSSWETVSKNTEINYLEGIIIHPFVTLTIRLESGSNFYVYGKPGGKDSVEDIDWISHAGIEVSSNSTLIIEQTKENIDGALIAVGSGSQNNNSDPGNGTGAGIGGRGSQFSHEKSVYEDDYGSCGTVIIRSGKIYACGGCGIVGEGKGTGAGIGGGGIWRGNMDHFGTIHSNQGGNIKIYGGEVEAYGGGTFNNEGGDKNVYYHKKDLFFNSSNGFYVRGMNETISTDHAEGTGAGIGGGGVYTDNELNVQMWTGLKLDYYGGCVNAYAGRGSNEDKNTSTRGVGAGIGGGGCYTSDGDNNSVHFQTDGTSNSTSGDESVVRIWDYAKYDTTEESSTARKNILYAHNKYGEGAPNAERLASYGGWCRNGSAQTGGNAGTKIPVEYWGESWVHGSNFSAKLYRHSPYEFPKEAYTAETELKIVGKYYAVDVAGKTPENIQWFDTIEGALKATNGEIPNGDKLYVKIDINDVLYKGVRNTESSRVKLFGYTKYSSIIDIQKDSKSLTRDELYNGVKNKNTAIKTASGVYLCVENGEYYDESIYGIDKDNKNKQYFDIVDCTIAFETDKDTTIKVKDILDNEKTINIEVEKYLAPPEEEEDTSDNDDVDNSDQEGLPYWVDIKNPKDSSYDKVYFGKTPNTEDYKSKGSEIKWRVLNTEANDDIKTAALFMLTEDVVAEKSFGSSSEWNKSSIKKFLQRNNEGSMYYDCFIYPECSSMLATDRTESKDVVVDNTTVEIKALRSPLSKEKIFLLSALEALDSTYGFDVEENRSLGNDDGWWTRSKKSGSEVHVIGINCGGIPTFARGDKTNVVRPATNVKLSRIIYAMDANDSGGATTKGVIAVPTKVPSEYRLAVYDSTRKGFNAEDITVAKGSAMKIKYTGSVAGKDNEFITVLIKGAEGKVKYYGRVASKGASGEVEMNLPSELAGGTYEALVCNEHNSGKKMTNYGGFKIVQLKVTSGEAELKIEYSLTSGGTFYENEADIPDPADGRIDKMFVKATIMKNGSQLSSVASGVTITITDEYGKEVAKKVKEASVVGEFLENKRFGVTVSGGSLSLEGTGAVTRITGDDDEGNGNEDDGNGNGGGNGLGGIGEPTPIAPPLHNMLDEEKIVLLDLELPEVPQDLILPDPFGDDSGVGDFDTLTNSIGEFKVIDLWIDDNIDWINWNDKQGVDWDSGECESERSIKTVLRYKDSTSSSEEDVLYTVTKVRSPIDVSENIYTNGQNKSYAVKYYSKNRGKVDSGGYMTLQEYSGTSDIHETSDYSGRVTVNDIPYRADSKIDISCSRSGDTVTAILTPAQLIKGSNIKEVGVRLEYDLNGITTGLVHKWNNVSDVSGGSFEYTFPNVPSKDVTCGAYYITVDNEEVSVRGGE